MGAAKKRHYDMSSRTAAAALTRTRILDASFTLFVELPYDDVTFARIAATAGVSVPTVVLHFKTKDGLIEALAEYARPREEALREVPDGNPLEAARRICARYEETGPAVLRFLAMEDRTPAVAPVLKHGRESHRAWVERTFGPRLGTGAARLRRVMELVVAYDLYTWHILRRVLDPEATIVAMAELARGVLEAKGGKR